MTHQTFIYYSFTETKTSTINWNIHHVDLV